MTKYRMCIGAFGAGSQILRRTLTVDNDLQLLIIIHVNMLFFNVLRYVHRCQFHEYLKCYTENLIFTGVISGKHCPLPQNEHKDKNSTTTKTSI